jgi:hypothetical protein
LEEYLSGFSSEPGEAGIQGLVLSIGENTGRYPAGLSVLFIVIVDEQTMSVLHLSRRYSTLRSAQFPKQFDQFILRSIDDDITKHSEPLD